MYCKFKGVFGMQKKTDRIFKFNGAQILPRKIMFEPFVSWRIKICHFYKI